MRVIIAGGRDFGAMVLCQAILHSGFDVGVVVSGGAKGVDFLGARWAIENRVNVEFYPANWAKYGKSAVSEC